MSVIATAISYFGLESIGLAVAELFVGSATAASLGSVALGAIGTATISGASTLLRGGSIGQAFTSALRAGASSWVGGTISKGVSSYVTEVSKGLDIVSPTTSKIIGNVVGTAIGQGSSAALNAAFNGKDALAAFKKTGLASLTTGAIGAGVTATAKNLGFDTTNAVGQAMTRATSAALVGALNGKDFGGSFLKSLSAQAVDALGNAVMDVAKTGWNSGADAALTKAEQKLESATKALGDYMGTKWDPNGPLLTQYNWAQSTDIGKQYLANQAALYDKVLSPAQNSDGTLNVQKLVDNMAANYEFRQAPNSPNFVYALYLPNINDAAYYSRDSNNRRYVYVDLTSAEKAEKTLVDAFKVIARSDIPEDVYIASGARGDLAPLENPPPESVIVKANELAAEIGKAQEEFNAASKEFLDQEARNTALAADAISPMLDKLVGYREAIGRELTADEQSRLATADDLDATYDRMLGEADKLAAFREETGRDMTARERKKLLAAEDLEATYADLARNADANHAVNDVLRLGIAPEGKPYNIFDRNTAKIVKDLGYAPKSIDSGIGSWGDFYRKGSYEEVAQYTRELMAKDALVAAGLSATDAAKAAGDFTGFASKDELLANTSAYADPLVTTKDEAADMFRDIFGRDATAQELAKFTGAESDVASAIQASWDTANAQPSAPTAGSKEDELIGGAGVDAEPEAPVVPEEPVVPEAPAAPSEPRWMAAARARSDTVKQFFRDQGLDSPSFGELVAIINNKSLDTDDKLRDAVYAYADPRATSADEAREVFEGLGYTPTDAELARFIGTGDRTKSITDFVQEQLAVPEAPVVPETPPAVPQEDTELTQGEEFAQPGAVDDAKGGKNVGIDTSTFETFKGVPLRDLRDGEDVPEIVITATRLDKPSPSDAEAWAKYQKELKDLGGASFSKFFKDQLDILTEAFKDTKPDTFANGVKNALAFGARNFGSLTSNLLRGAEAFGLDKNSAALRTTQALERWGKTNQSSNILDAEGQFTNAINGITKESLAAKLGTTPDKISSFQAAAEQMRELGRQAVNNPLGTFSTVLGEAAQEVPFLVVSGGVGSVASKVLSKAGAFAVARGTDASLNGFESFSGNYAEVKDYLTKNGYSDKAAEAKAVASGLEAMGVTMLTSWVGDKAIVKSFMGDLTKDSVAGIAGAGAKEYVMGYVEGGLQNASAQIAKYGQVRNMAEVTASGTIEGFVQAGLTTSTLSSDKLSQVVARDYDGNAVKLGSILDGTSTFDPSTLNPNFELTAGFNIGDAVKYQQVFDKNPDITPTEYLNTAKFFRAEGLDPTISDIENVAGGKEDITGDDLKKSATAYADARVVTNDEARQTLIDLGYDNPTQQEIDAFVGRRDETETIASIISQYDPLATTPEEVKSAMTALGYATPTDAEAKALSGKIKESEAQKSIESYVGQHQITRSEAEQYFKDIGYSPTEEELTRFIKQGENVLQDAVQSDISAYTDPRMVDEQEVRDAYAALGLNKPTTEDVQKLIGQYSESDLATRSEENLDKARYNSIMDQLENMAFESGISPEALQAIKDDFNSQLEKLGVDVGSLSNNVGQVQADVASLKSDLSSRIEAAAQAGADADAALQSGLDSLAGELGVTKESLLARLGTTESKLRQDFASQIGGVQTQIGGVQEALSQAIADAKAVGLAGDSALQAAINKVAADQGTTAQDLLTKIGATEASLKSQFASQIGNVQTQIGDVKSALTQAIEDAKAIGLSGDAALQAGLDSLAAEMGVNQETLLTQLNTTQADLQKQFGSQISGLDQKLTDAIADAKAVGLAGDAALKSAIDKVAADQGTTAQELLSKIGTTEANLKSQFSDQLGQVQSQIGDVQSALTQAIADAKAAGLSGDAALQSAIDLVASDLGTTKGDLLSQLGKTEASLRSEFSSQLGQVQSQIGDTRTALEQAIADAKAVGLSGDAALQSAINTVAGDLGTTKESLLSRLGATETSLRQDFASQIGGVQSQISDVQNALTQAIADAKASGLSGDSALQNAINKVASDMGVNKEEVLGQLGKTAEQLRTDFATQLGEVQTQLGSVQTALQQAIADAKSAGLQGDAALQSAIETVAGDLGTTRNDLLSQLGRTEEQLRGDFASQIGAVTSDLQSKFNSLTAEQKALANQLSQQGVDLRTAIETAISGMQSDAQAKYNALTASQKALADQLTQQGVDFSTAIAQAQSQTQEQIAGVSADVQAKYNSLTADQKALADALRQQGVDLSTAIDTVRSSIQADVESKFSSLSAEQKALATALQQQGVDLNTAIEQAKAQTSGQIQGLSADMQAKYASLTADQKALAQQLQQQGVDLGTAINTAAASIQADVQAKYDSLNASQKALADQLTQQGVDLSTAIDTAIAGVQSDVQSKYDSLTNSQKALANQLAQQGVDLREAINIASQQSQQQVLDLGQSLNQRVDQLMQQGMDQYAASQQAIAEVTAQNQQLQGLVGTQGRGVAQSDIDALTQMLGGQKPVDLAYDVTGDKKITQDDLDFLQGLITGNQTQWTAPQGSPWAATGLYGQIAASDAQRRAERAAAEQRRQADIAAQVAREQEAARQSALRTTAAQAQTQIQNVIGQLPQAYKSMQQTTTPVYAGEMQDFSLSSPLDVGFFDLRKEAQGGQKQQQTTKIATGGYLDDLLDLLR